jgi:hypothetical protein
MSETEFSMGQTIRLALFKPFMKYCEQHVAIRDRISTDIVALIAGRCGTVISAPIVSSKGIESRRISILTKDGVVQCQNIPIQLIIKVTPTQPAIQSKSTGEEMDQHKPATDEDANAVTRGHILMALKDSTCRSGKHAVTGEVDARKSELILIALKKETTAKKMKKMNLPHLNKPVEDTITMTDSLSQDDLMNTALIGDGDGQLDPIGVCFLDNNNDNEEGADDNKDPSGQMFSVESTLIKSYPMKEKHLDDIQQIDETSDKFSSTIQQMITASDHHASTLKQNQLKKSHCRSIKIEKKKQQPVHVESSLEEASNSEFLFVNSLIAERNIEDNGLFDYSQSINSLSTAATHTHTQPSPRGNTFLSSKPTAIRPPLHPETRSKAPPPYSLQPPHIEIKISPLQPHVDENKADAEVSARSGMNTLHDTVKMSDDLEIGEEGNVSFQNQAGDWEASVSIFHEDRQDGGGLIEKERAPESTYLQRFLQESSVNVITRQGKQSRDHIVRSNNAASASSAPQSPRHKQMKMKQGQQQQQHRHPSRPCTPPSSNNKGGLRAARGRENLALAITASSTPTPTPALNTTTTKKQ